MRGLLELLSCKLLVPHQAAEMTFAAASGALTPPAIPNDGGGTASILRWRFVRIEAHDGDLLVTIENRNANAGAPGTGSPRVLSGTNETFQLADVCSVNVAPVAGTVHGAIIWMR